MSGTTAKHVIPYSVSGDTVQSAAPTMQSLAERLDLLLGESGSFTFTGIVANTPISQAITLSRTYPGNAGGSMPGIVILQMANGFTTAQATSLWVPTWTGTATTITGFTISYISNTNANRTIQWRFLPCVA